MASATPELAITESRLEVAPTLALLMNNLKDKPDPVRTVRKIVMDCADCDCCRPIMDESCLFFPELYRLYDQEVETGQKISPEELRQLVEKCNFCALCPCPNIRRTSSGQKPGLSNGTA